MGPSGSGDHGAISRHLKVLLPPSSSSSSHKLHISDDFARRLDGGAGGTALVVSPVCSKVWRVEVGRDGDGAFLGRGWPEFAAAHGIGALWFVVLRHEGDAVLTVKVFDTSCCLHQFSRRLNVAANGTGAVIGHLRPQFIMVLLRGFTEKMAMPSSFVRNNIAAGARTNRELTTALLNLCGKYWRVELHKDRSGSMFFSGGWARFLASNGIMEGEALILRHEGNMVFTVKVFGLNGCQKSFKHPQGAIRQSDDTLNQAKAAPLSSTEKRNNSICTYEIGPTPWIKKEMKAYALKQYLLLTSSFCKAIGFTKACVITLRTSTPEGGTRSWNVRGKMFSKSSNKLLQGWTYFCRDNGLKEGDVLTFNIIKPTLWHVDVTRRS